MVHEEHSRIQCFHWFYIQESGVSTEVTLDQSDNVCKQSCSRVKSEISQYWIFFFHLNDSQLARIWSDQSAIFQDKGWKFVLAWGQQKHQKCIPRICETSPDLVLRWWRTAKKTKKQPTPAFKWHLLCNWDAPPAILQYNTVKEKRITANEKKKKKSQHPPRSDVKAKMAHRPLMSSLTTAWFSFCVTVKTSGTYWSHCAVQGRVLRQQQLH